MGLSNLPPGVTESMIPGNRPEDVLYDRVLNETCGNCEEYRKCYFCDTASEENCEIVKEAWDAAQEGPDPDRAYDEAHGR